MAKWNLRKELPALLAEAERTFELKDLTALRDADHTFLSRRMGNAVRSLSDPTEETAQAVVNDLAYIAHAMLTHYELTPTSTPVHDPHHRINGYHAMYDALIGAGAIMNGEAPHFYHQMAEYVRRDVEETGGDLFVLVPRFAALVLEPLRLRGTKTDIYKALELMDEFNVKTAQDIIPHRWMGRNETSSTPSQIAYQTSRRFGESLRTENENSQSPKRVEYPPTAQGDFNVSDTIPI